MIFSPRHIETVVCSVASNVYTKKGRRRKTVRARKWEGKSRRENLVETNIHIKNNRFVDNSIYILSLLSVKNSFPSTYFQPWRQNINVQCRNSSCGGKINRPNRCPTLQSRPARSSRAGTATRRASWCTASSPRPRTPSAATPSAPSSSGTCSTPSRGPSRSRRLPTRTGCRSGTTRWLSVAHYFSRVQKIKIRKVQP